MYVVSFIHDRKRGLDVLRVVVDVDFVLQLPEHVGGLLLHIFKNGDFVGEVVDGRNLGDEVVNLLFQVVIHNVVYLFTLQRYNFFLIETIC